MKDYDNQPKMLKKVGHCGCSPCHLVLSTFSEPCDHLAAYSAQVF